MSYHLLGTVNNTRIKLGNVLLVSNYDSSAVAATGVNLLSLIQTTAFVANGNNFISLPLGVNLLGLANINTQIQVISFVVGDRYACSRRRCFMYDCQGSADKGGYFNQYGKFAGDFG